MKRILVACMVVLAARGVPWASGQAPAPAPAPAPKQKTLDSRSVLMSWTNEPPVGDSDKMRVGGPIPAAVKPAAVASNPPVLPPKDANLNEPPLPSPYDKQVEEASQLVRSGKAEEGVKSLLDVLAREPKHRRARFEIGTAYIQMERYRDALDLLEPMTVEFPNDYFLKNNLSWLYATAKDPSIRDGAKAVRMAQDALFIAPGDFHVWSTLSEAYYIAGQYSKAMRAAEEALRLASQSGLSGRALDEYRRQVTKSQKAAEATSVLE